MEVDCAVTDSFQKMLVIENDGGFLIPPTEDMRIMVDKVARFVASIKPRLESFIGRNAGMRKYGFMNASDPYHAYYQHQLSKFRAQNGWSADEPEVTIDEPDIVTRVRKMIERNENSEAVNNTVVVSPLTGELITVNNMSQHMQDPTYKEQKERLFAKIRETTLAQDDKISKTFIWLARDCPDIFGTTEEKVCNAVMKEINPSLILDGAERRLVPEYRFLARHSGGPACIIVVVPQKWELLEITVESLCESVGSFKDKLAREIAVPANKQKLKLEWYPGLFKDSLSLAYYNVAGGDLLSVSW